MQDRHPRNLLLAAATALAAGWLARTSPPIAAAFTALATLLALRRWCWPAGLAALPAMLAALPPPPVPAPPLPPGPVFVVGIVREVRRDLVLGEQAMALETAGGRVWLRTELQPDLLPGDRLAATARSSAPAVPGDRGSLRAAVEACRREPGRWSLPRLAAAARRAIEASLARLVPGSDGAVLSTLVLGNGTRLPDDVAAAHRATGLSHLLAVSGAHAAMLAWLLGLQPFGTGRRRPVGRAHLTFALGSLVVYGAITGFEPPVFRALCSYALVAMGLQVGRRAGAVHGLAWPALASAVVAPDGALGPSFCLSYAAVAGLCLAGGPRSRAPLEAWLLAPVRASLWATVTTAPLTLLWFGQLAPWTILLTPLLAPLVGALLFLGLGSALATMLVPALAAPLAPVLRCLTDGYLSAVAAADRLPATPVFAPTAPPLALLVAGIATGVVAFALVRGRRGALLGCAICCVPHFVPLAPQPAAVHLFAVGHGQCCLCTLADGRNLLIDCGSMQHRSLPARKVERALRRRRIDLAVLTHADHDHTGAMVELLRRVPVGTVVLPTSMRDTDLARAIAAQAEDIVWLAPGERLQPWPTVAVAAPQPAQPSDNDESLWIEVQLPGIRLLATGDAEGDGVRAALAAGIARPADVLVLPHHGRPNPAAAELLTAVAPRLCLASNRHGEGPSALGEFAARTGIATFATGVAGDLVLQCPSPAGVDPPQLWFSGGLRVELGTR